VSMGQPPISNRSAPPRTKSQRHRGRGLSIRDLTLALLYSGRRPKPRPPRTLRGITVPRSATLLSLRGDSKVPPGGALATPYPTVRPDGYPRTFSHLLLQASIATSRLGTGPTTRGNRRVRQPEGRPDSQRGTPLLYRRERRREKGDGH
jgi:hypothetical protein